MQKFHILHYIPGPVLHILNGYQEVIDTLLWGFRSLHYEATSCLNQWRSDATNILLGAQFMTKEILDNFPPNTCIYNLEQLNGCMRAGLDMGIYRYMAENFRILDYSEENIAVWNAEFSARRATLLPIGYAPSLQRIPQAANLDIDVLFYGQFNEFRSRTLESLCRRGLKMVSFYGLYGAARDELISRSKIVLNLRSRPEDGIFSIVRVSYLLANRKAVVSDSTLNERDLIDSLGVTEIENIPLLCEQLAQNPEQRAQLEERGYQTFAKRDIRGFLETALLKHHFA